MRKYSVVREILSKNTSLPLGVGVWSSLKQINKEYKYLRSHRRLSLSVFIHQQEISAEAQSPPQAERESEESEEVDGAASARSRRWASPRRTTARRVWSEHRRNHKDGCDLVLRFQILFLAQNALRPFSTQFQYLPKGWTPGTPLKFLCFKLIFLPFWDLGTLYLSVLPPILIPSFAFGFGVRLLLVVCISHEHVCDCLGLNFIPETSNFVGSWCL